MKHSKHFSGSRFLLGIALLSSTWGSACGSDGGSEPADTAGAAGAPNGGQSDGGDANGGEPGRGGSSGGDPGAGGETSGGEAGTAGAPANGGTPDGGEPASGGMPGVGGEPTNGGEPATGGDSNTGGASEGGTPGDGGMAGGGASSSGAPSVSLLTTIDDVPANVPFVAFQDGDSPWEPAEGMDGEYRFEPSGDRYGVAVACLLGDTPSKLVWVFRALASELAELRRECPTLPPETHTLSVSAQDLEAGQSAWVRWGTTQLISVTADDPESGGTVAEGEYTVVVPRFEGGVTNRFIIHRNYEFFGDRTLSLDFGAEGFDPVQGSVLASGVPDDELNVSVSLLGDVGEDVDYESAFGLAYEAIPEEELEEGDIQLIRGRWFDYDLGVLREQTLGRRDLSGEVEIRIPPMPETPIVARTATSPYVRVRLDGERPPDARVFSLFIAQLADDEPRDWEEHVTSGWLGDGEALTLETADLRELEGWDDELGLAGEYPVYWRFEVRGTNRGVGQALFGPRNPVTGTAWPEMEGSMVEGTRVEGALP